MLATDRNAGVLPDQIGKGGREQARIIPGIHNDQGFHGLEAVGPDHAFRGPAREPAQVLLGEAPGGGVGQALAHRVPQQQKAGVNPEKLEDGFRTSLMISWRSRVCAVMVAI